MELRRLYTFDNFLLYIDGFLDYLSIIFITRSRVKTH